MDIKEKANGFLAKLPFTGMAEKIPAGARAKVPALNKAIPFANQIACALVLGIVVTLVACGGGKSVEQLTKESQKLAEQMEGLDPGNPDDAAKLLKLAGQAAKLAAELEKAETKAVGGGSAAAGAAGAVKGKGKVWTLSKDSDFKYDLVKIDGVDYVEIQNINLPTDFAEGKLVNHQPVLVDTVTLKIPAKIEGYPVGVIGEDALGSIKNGVYLTSVTIPDTVIEIKNSAFFGSSISSIKLPKNLKKLGSHAFKNCENLGGSITIPAGITEIPEEAFSGAMHGPKITEVIIPDSVTTIGGGAFYNCEELTTVKLPSHPLKYPNGEYTSSSQAFLNCPKLSLATRKAIEESGYKDKFAF